MRPRAARSTGLWGEIDQARKSADLTQAEMAQILGISRGSYASEVRRGREVPLTVWARYQQWVTLPPPVNEEIMFLGWNGEDHWIPLPNIVKRLKCAKCQKLVFTTAHNRKYCDNCKKGRKHRWQR